MPLPMFNAAGDLPPGVYQAMMEEVMDRFGSGSEKREQASAALARVHRFATVTGHLLRFIVFGSYVSDKKSPNDVDIILVMDAEFRVDSCGPATLVIFDHERAQQELGASIFWTRPGLLFLESVDDFVAGWQRKRDNSLRGIVEVIG